MSRSFIFLLSLLNLSALAADCPHCPSNEQGEVRVRGVLQKKPSSVAYIQPKEAEPAQEAPSLDEPEHASEPASE